MFVSDRSDAVIKLAKRFFLVVTGDHIADT
jgi:hypothetical protein